MELFALLTNSQQQVRLIRDVFLYEEAMYISEPSARIHYMHELISQDVAEYGGHGEEEAHPEYDGEKSSRGVLRNELNSGEARLGGVHTQWGAVRGATGIPRHDILPRAPEDVSGGIWVCKRQRWQDDADL